MKLLALALALTAFAFLAACESTTAKPASADSPRGSGLGDSNVHVSGSLQTGGSVNNH